MSRTISLRNGNVLLANGRLDVCDVLIEHGIVSMIGHGLRAPNEIEATDLTVVPGLIDLHVHGLGYESSSTSQLARLCELEAAHGATTFYPTFFAPPEEVKAQLERHRRETEELSLTPQIGGFRLESPYLAKSGGGLSRDTAPVSVELTQMLLDAGGGHIKIWDISPDLEHACDAISAISARGVVCSIAHTNATIDQARAAVDAGARLVTHLFNTFQLADPPEPGVYPAGLVDYLLVEDRVTCEIIGDGTHVPPLLVEKALRCKGVDRLAFVTDSNLGAALPPGRYDLPMGWGLAEVNGPNNGVRLVERDMVLCGSALTPIDAFRNAIRLFGWDIATASRVCSRTPARLMGLNKGEIAQGVDADMLVLDADLDITHTIVGGKVIYQR